MKFPFRYFLTIYNIPYKDCCGKSIAQTSQWLRSRICQHKNGRVDIEKKALVKYSLSFNIVVNIILYLYWPILAILYLEMFILYRISIVLIFCTDIGNLSPVEFKHCRYFTYMHKDKTLHHLLEAL